MGYPRGNSWDALHDAGLRHVVCLTHASAPYDSSPLALHHAPLQDLYNRHEPDDPDAERARGVTAARYVVDRLEAGEGVVVHCHAGRGRTGTVIGAALVMLGHDPDDRRRLAPPRAAHARQARAGPSSPGRPTSSSTPTDRSARSDRRASTCGAGTLGWCRSSSDASERSSLASRWS